jgi:hypothetical protein
MAYCIIAGSLAEGVKSAFGPFATPEAARECLRRCSFGGARRKQRSSH